MSVYFSKYSLNGYRDHGEKVDPAIRDRLLSAINELALLGPGLPKHKDLSTRMQTHRSTQLAIRASNERSAGPHKESANQVKREKILQNLGLSTSLATHGVRKERTKYINTAYSNEEKGSVVVLTRGLHQETEYKIIEVTYLTTSQELVKKVLKDSDTQTKDPNLFYLAMETGIKSKDFGLPISQMIVLEDDARPLELQACQPQGETKFHLKMKSGGLIRVRTNILNTGSTFKTVFIARCTTAQDLIKLIINGCKIDEAPQNFVLREGSTDFQVDRILTHDEYPLEVQTNWKPNEAERSFFLSRISRKLDTSHDQTTEIPTSDELRTEIEKQKQTINILNKTIQKLQLEQAKHELPSSRNDFSSMRTSSSVDSGYVKDDYDHIDDISIRPFEAQENSDYNDFDEEYRPSVEQTPRQRKTSIDALDLHEATINQALNGDEKAKTTYSQNHKLRSSFYHYQKHSINSLDFSNKEDKVGKTVNSTSSQIKRSKLKFLEYYNVKSDRPQRRISSVLMPPTPRRRNISQEKNIGRSYSASDAESTRIDPKFHSILQTVFSRKSSVDNICGKEMEDVFDHSPATRDFLGDDCANSSFLSIFDILEDMRLVKVTLKRDPGKDLGLEIAHVTQTLPSNSNDEGKDAGDLVYVVHKNDGQTVVVKSPIEDTDAQNKTERLTSITELCRPKNSELVDDEEKQFSPVNLESHLNNKTFIVHNVEDTTHEKSKDEKSSSLNVESCCAFSSWRDSWDFKPRHGVRIVGIANGSIAANTRELERGDVIVEVNGRNVLNSSLVAVITTLKQLDSVQLVVAREKQATASKEDTVEPLPVKTPQTSGQNDMKTLTDQIEQLGSKVTELQDSLAKKDITIASLKKSLIKKKLRISSKEKIVEGEQVMV